MDAVFSIYKGTMFLLSIFKDTDYVNKMDTNKEVISRLKFISRINKGEKINVRNAYPFVQQDDMSTRLSRTFYYKDNRGNGLNFIRNTVDRSFELVNIYKTSHKQSERVMSSHIIEDLKRAKNGINNLKETYMADTMFCCDLDTIIQEMDAKLSEMPDKKEEEKDPDDDLE